MEESRADMVMKFVMKGGGPVWGESTLDVLKEDPLMHGFKAISSYDDYSNFFEVTAFSFAVQVKPHEEGVGALSRNTGAHGANGGRAAAAQDQFSRWRSATEDEYKKIHFPLEFDTFTFSRVIDGASPTFFSACCNQESFERASLVKRGLERRARRNVAAIVRVPAARFQGRSAHRRVVG